MLLDLPPARELPDAPAPVLDQQRRPQMDSSGIIQGLHQLAASGQLPSVSAEPFLAPGRGLETIGRGIGDVGEVIKAVEMEKAKAQNDIHVMRGINELSRTIADANATRDMADPGSWSAHLDDKTSTVIDDYISSNNLSPNAARDLKLQGENVLAHARIDASTSSSKATFAQWDDLKKSQQYAALDNGEIPAAKALMKERVDRGSATLVEQERFEHEVIPGHQKQKEKEQQQSKTAMEHPSFIISLKIS